MFKCVSLALLALCLTAGELVAQCPCRSRGSGLLIQSWSFRDRGRSSWAPAGAWDQRYAPYNTSPYFAPYVDGQGSQLRPPVIIVEVNNALPRWDGSEQGYFQTAPRQFSTPLQFSGPQFSPCPGGSCPIR